MWNNTLLWFGAAVSVAEILTGTWLAPLGWQQGLLAIILGHIIGGGLFFAAGYIGAKTNRSAMQSVQISFGSKGSVFFSLANLLQLLGWTAIMIFSGAQISAALSQQLWQWGDLTLWGVIIGVFILLWIFLGSKQLNILRGVLLVAMFVIVLWLSQKLFSANLPEPATSDAMSFGTAVELAAIMPLSWLPLVSDYTRNAKRPFATAFTATLAYGFTSIWMYALGLAAALFAAQSDIAQMLLFAGLGVAGVLVVLLSTVTTTFLDVYSAGVSANNISQFLREKPTAVAVTIIGTILAVSLPVTEYENFLLLIGSVFAPMISVQIADFFVFQRQNVQNNLDITGLSLWLIGFILYRVLLAYEYETVLGLTFPVMIATFVLACVVRKFAKN